MKNKLKEVNKRKKKKKITAMKAKSIKQLIEQGFDL